MEVNLHSATKTIEFVVNGVSVPARIWEGVTAGGVKCHAYITRIAVDKDDDAAEFERELREQRAPSLEIQAIPLRMIL